MEKKFQYVIKVDGKPVWRGLNVKRKFSELKRKNPAKRVGIAWETSEDVLVCLL
jgi:hypothetical protein